VPTKKRSFGGLKSKTLKRETSDVALWKRFVKRVNRLNFPFFFCVSFERSETNDYATPSNAVDDDHKTRQQAPGKCPADDPREVNDEKHNSRLIVFCFCSGF